MKGVGIRKDCGEVCGEGSLRIYFRVKDRSMSYQQNQDSVVREFDRDISDMK